MMTMNRSGGAAARLPEGEHKALAVRALRHLESIFMSKNEMDATLNEWSQAGGP
ncbi:MAG: hypothetical protein H7346_20495 [Burkholderiaceae bacterium]|nr:hypothetical protein [Burkholderiaceae bacterium]